VIVPAAKVVPFASTKLSSMNVSRFHCRMLQQCHKLDVVAPSSKYPGKDFFHSIINASIFMADVQIGEMLRYLQNNFSKPTTEGLLITADTILPSKHLM